MTLFDRALIAELWASTNTLRPTMERASSRMLEMLLRSREVDMITKLVLAFVAVAFLAAPVLAQTTPAPAAPGAAQAAPMAQKKSVAKTQAKHKAKPKRFGGRD